jgi:hypothetical protein
MRTALVLALALSASGCAGAPAGAPAPPPPPPAGSASPACASPEHRQLDFWIGDWDLVVRDRKAPDVDAWQEARATQHVEAAYGGCVIAERFAADGPGTPWAGASYSAWQPALGTWHQTWVDDQGSYLAFTGGLEAGVMTLYGEPSTKDGKQVQMRMVFLDVTADALRWEWQRSVDGGAWSPAMIIEYRRRR